jgi:hypothetical protein
MPKDPKNLRGKIRHSIETLEGSLIRQVAETNLDRDNVIALWFGEPNMTTPDFIKQAATVAPRTAAFRPCARFYRNMSANSTAGPSSVTG